MGGSKARSGAPPDTCCRKQGKVTHLHPQAAAGLPHTMIERESFARASLRRWRKRGAGNVVYDVAVTCVCMCVFVWRLGTDEEQTGQDDYSVFGM